MKALIPAKTGSIRVPDKNFREFFEGKCLVELLIDKLVKVLSPRDIYISCNDYSKKEMAERLGVQFHHREEYLTLNSTPYGDVVQKVSLDLPDDDDIMWCHPTEPLFDEYGECLKIWNGLDKAEYDSLVVCYPMRRHILDQNFKPIGFGFGPWHSVSQDLPLMYHVNFTLGILTRNWLRQCGYPIGRKPYWYEVNHMCIDIDDMEDWEIAKIVYEYKMKGENHNG